MRFKVQGTGFKVQRSTFNEERVHWRTGAFVYRKVFSIIYFLFSILLLLVLFLISCSDPPVPGSSELSPKRPLVHAPVRIVSLAPSITETLFILGLGDRVAGVTRYCDYPPEAAEKPVVGGYFDVNYEMLMSLKADLIILLIEHEDARKRLMELGCETLPVNHSRVTGILESITTIANRCAIPERGKALRDSLESRIMEIQKDLSPPPRFSPSPPRVLVAVGRLMDKSSGGEIFISGRDGFYDDLIAMAGGVNAYREETLKFPAISDEGLVRLDPDIILEMVPDLADETDREALRSLWREKRSVRAAREGRVHILGEDYVVVPGPRFVDLLEDMAEIINSVEN